MKINFADQFYFKFFCFNFKISKFFESLFKTLSGTVNRKTYPKRPFLINLSPTVTLTEFGIGWAHPSFHLGFGIFGGGSKIVFGFLELRPFLIGTEHFFYKVRRINDFLNDEVLKLSVISF